MTANNGENRKSLTFSKPYKTYNLTTYKFHKLTQKTGFQNPTNPTKKQILRCNKCNKKTSFKIPQMHTL